MIRSNPPQLSVGICDMLDTLPHFLPPPPADSIHMPIYSGMQISGWGKIKGRRYPQQKVCLRVAGEDQSINPGGGALPPALPWDLQAMGSQQLLTRASVLEAVAKETVLKWMLLPLSSDSTPKTASSRSPLSSLPAQGPKSHR